MSLALRFGNRILPFRFPINLPLNDVERCERAKVERRGSVVSFCCIVGIAKIAKRNGAFFRFNGDICFPKLNPFFPADALVWRSVFSIAAIIFLHVLMVLLFIAEAHVRSAIVESVAVNVVYYLGWFRIKNETVHRNDNADSARVNSRAGVSGVSVFGFEDVPRIGTEDGKVGIVYENLGSVGSDYLCHQKYPLLNFQRGNKKPHSLVARAGFIFQQQKLNLKRSRHRTQIIALSKSIPFVCCQGTPLKNA